MGNEDISDGHEIEALEGVSRGEALRSMTFWVVSSCVVCWSALSTAIFFHLSDIFAEVFLQVDDLDSTLRVVYVSQSIASAAFSLGMGFLFDRYRIEYLLIAASSIQVLATLLLSTLEPTAASAGLFAVAFGAQNGSMNNMSSMAFAKLFGRRELNRITSVATSLAVVGSALGPLPLGAANDLFHGYSHALMLALAWPSMNLALLLARVIYSSVFSSSGFHSKIKMVAAGGSDGMSVPGSSDLEMTRPR